MIYNFEYLFFFYLIFLIFLSLLLIFFLCSSIIFYIKTKVPFVPSSKKEIKDIINYILTYFPDKDNLKIAELGCGDGRIVFELAKLNYKVDGYEINSFLYFFLKLQIFFLKNKKNINFYRKDFLKEDLTKYDIFITYLSSFVIEELILKIKNSNIKKEIFLISNTFKLSKNKIFYKINNIYVYKI